MWNNEIKSNQIKSDARHIYGNFEQLSTREHLSLSIIKYITQTWLIARLLVVKPESRTYILSFLTLLCIGRKQNVKSFSIN